MAGATFITVAFFHHVVSLSGKLQQFETFLKVNYVIGCGFLVGVWSPYFITKLAPILEFPFWPQPGFLFHAFLIWWVAIVVFAHWQLWKEYWSEKGVRRRQYAFLLAASGIGFLGGATNFPLWYGIEIPPFGNIFVTVYVAIVGYTFLRYHLMDYSVYVEKGLSYFSLLLLVSQPVYPALLLAQKSVFGAINIRYSVVQLVAHLLTVAGAYQMNRGAKGALARTILKGREYRFQTLHRLSSKVSHCQDISEICQAILEALGKGLGASRAGIFILRPEENRYRALSTYGFPGNHPLLVEGWDISDQVPQMLLCHQASISLKELSNYSESSWEQEVASQLQEFDLELCHPVFSHHQLVGILVLGAISGKASSLLDGNNVSLWDTMLQESTLALENALLREEVQQTRSRLCQIDRMHSVEAMADGLTQELLHPVLAMKAFVQIAKLRRHDRDFMDGLSRMIGDDLSKIEQLTQEIREYVKPLANSSRTVLDIHSTIESCLLFFSDKPAYPDMKFLKRFGSANLHVRMDRQSLIQVLFNVILLLIKVGKESKRTLVIMTQSKMQYTGETLADITIQWVSSSSALETPGESVLAQVEKYEDSINFPSDSREARGIFLAREIIQNFSGMLSLLTFQNEIYGVKIQLPAHHAPDTTRFTSSLDSFPAATGGVNLMFKPDSRFP